MASRDPTSWMWAEACHMLQEAERLHRQFFRPARGGTHPVWEPPIDVFEDEDEVLIVVALPGVAPDRVDVSYDTHSVRVRAERRIPFADEGYAIGRLEIPYGYFERRIALPAVAVEPPAQKWVNGCLILRMRKREVTG